MKIIRVMIILVLFLSCGLTLRAQQEQAADQQFSDFNLVSYGEKGKKLWEIDGKSADILSDIVKLTQVVANVYGAQEDINIKADTGNFNKADNKMHLEKNVVITTSKGGKLTTDSLDWDRQADLISTKAPVNLERDNMIVDGQGAQAQPNLKKFNLEKDVKVQIKPEEGKPADKQTIKSKIDIACEGPLEVDYEKNLATFKNNVSVNDGTMQLYSDMMDVYFTTVKDKSAKAAAAGMGGSIIKIIAKGNVKIVRGENTSFSEEATYFAQDKKIILTGKPKLVIYSTEGMNASP